MDGAATPFPGTLQIAVLLGGTSAEREISLKSGAAVIKALTERGHRVTSIDPAETDLETVDYSGIDALFLALHGTFGEDGEVQAILDRIGVPYTGSGAETSRLAFSKSATKERLLISGLPTPPYALIHDSDSARRISNLAESIGYPLAVKPDAQGSSLGVSIVETPEDLPRALNRAFHYDSFCLLEQAVIGTEWTLGLVDDLVLPLIQIEPRGKFFDYRAKYEDEDTGYNFEFALPTNVVKAIEVTGLAACRALRTAGIVRVDLMLDAQLRPWVLEINTIPGLTDHSLVPKAAARLGMDLGELCERAVLNCLEPAGRHHR